MNAIIQLLLNNIYEVIRRSRIVGIIIDVREILERVEDSIKSLSIQCDKDRGPLVSIIIPTRNEQLRLPTLLYSLKNSCYENLEIVIADYMSTDNTRKIASMFGAKVLDIDKPGIGYASHIAVNECKGEIIIRTDADAIFPKDIISIITKVLKRENKLIAHIGHIL